MKLLVNCLLVSLAVLLLDTQGPPPDPSIDLVVLKSKIFHNTRSLRVLLPAGYTEPVNRERHYPVLYFHDGIATFSPRAINIKAIIEPLIRAGALPPMIVVGIDNGGSTLESKNPAADRANEFLPYPDTGFPGMTYEPDPPHPQGQLYPLFLSKEVMPLINHTYRTRTGASHTSLGGFSFGATCALYCAIKMPNAFGRLLLESTPLWIGPDNRLLKDCESCKHWPAIISIGVGSEESPDKTIVNQGRALHDRLVAAVKQNAPKSRIVFVVDEGGKHDAASWGKRLPEVLKVLYSGWDGKDAQRLK
ncbi:MAG: hypothetical protein LAP85_08460 [Acidobacteriia bacterium]|nr:hypothetical protein [Terriglobia bacterium]